MATRKVSRLGNVSYCYNREDCSPGRATWDYSIWSAESVDISRTRNVNHREVVNEQS